MLGLVGSVARSAAWASVGAGSDFIEVNRCKLRARGDPNGVFCFTMVRGLLAALGLLLQRGPPNSQTTPHRAFLSQCVIGDENFILPVTVGGSRPLSIILDSGMAFDGVLIYNSALADSIELRSPFQATLGGAGSGPPQTALVADSMSSTRETSPSRTSGSSCWKATR